MWVFLVACGGADPDRVGGDGDADVDADADADADADTDLDHSGWHSALLAHSGLHSTATVTTADTATVPPIDCSVLPPGPRPFTALNGWGLAEDFDLDLDGYHLAIEQNNLRRKNQAGQVQLVATGFEAPTAGTRVLATGDRLVNEVAGHRLTLVDQTTGARSTVLAGLAYPNGLEVDRQNRAYVADNGTGVVHMVDVYTQDHWVVARNLIEPNGVILSPDEQTLYVGSFSGARIYALDRLTDTTWGQARVLYRDPNLSGGYDGINVDACGNVYFTEFLAGRVYRITPDGAQLDLIADVPSVWIPNLRWGSGVGGWDPDLLYVADRQQGRLFAIDVGLPGKRHVGLP